MVVFDGPEGSMLSAHDLALQQVKKAKKQKKKELFFYSFFSLIIKLVNKLYKCFI